MYLFEAECCRKIKLSSDQISLVSKDSRTNHNTQSVVMQV